MNDKKVKLNDEKVVPYHGEVSDPKTRCKYAGLSNAICNEIEKGKFFPATRAGITDHYAKDDNLSNLPPEDGKIASGGRTDALVLDETGVDRWPKHEFKSGAEIELSWAYTAAHRTRRWNYFITNPDWDPNKPLSREQFYNIASDPTTPDNELGYYDPNDPNFRDCKPFHTDLLTCQPLWNCDKPISEGGLIPSSATKYKIKFPYRVGYHVVLCVWEVADTGNAFYSVLDINFTP